MSTYVPTWPGLFPRDLLRRPTARQTQPFPFNVPERSFYYRERNGLYHLFRALRRGEADWALVPDYHHGNEVRAIRAAGFDVRFYPITRDLTADLGALVDLCKQRPRVVLFIHYLGWPQPLDEVLPLCRELGIVTVEDCALSLLSESEGVALGSRADHALFCLYKTVPVPNGGLLVHNGGGEDVEVDSAHLDCGVTSLVARTLDLAIEGLRGRHDTVGGALAGWKARGASVVRRSAMKRWPVGDDGFDGDGVDLRMSRLSGYLLDRFEFQSIRERRRDNFEQLSSMLAGDITPLRDDLAPGVCPLFFPILVQDKATAARALWARGIGAVEFWNSGDPAAVGPRHDRALFLRRHVLELPVHQDLGPEHLEYMASELRELGLRMSM